MRGWFSLFLLAASVAFTAYGMSTLTFLTGSGRPGSGFFPILVGLGLIATTTLTLIGELRAHPSLDGVNPEGEAASPERHGGTVEGEVPFVRDTVIVAGTILFLVAMLNVLGGLLAMIAFMLVLLFVLNREHWKTNIIYSIALPTGLYLMFSTLLNASVPEGIFGF